MITLSLEITLLSDTELGSGLGTELIDGLLPRDARGQPHLPARHLKGLLRERLGEITASLGWTAAAHERLLGIGGREGDDGSSALVDVQSATQAPIGKPGGSSSSPPEPTVLIARTAVGPLGTVVAGSLRTTEAISAQTRFRAIWHLDAQRDDVFDLLLRVGLLSIDAIGSKRTRGAGRCRIEIEGETRSPGTLLFQLAPLLAAYKPEDERRTLSPTRRFAEGKTRWYQMIFRADSPICCPETPILSGSNHLRTGPVIPASAVQGALLTHLSAVDPVVASSCLADRRFRAWPLVPVSDKDDEEIPFGVRVDLAHRLSKIPLDGQHEFRDPAIEPYHWSDVVGGSPLKSSDGVLRRSSGGEVSLWRSVDVPRIISAHGVHYDPTGRGERNLFSEEALAPVSYSGLLAMPEEAAQLLSERLERVPEIRFGKARSVRGSGRLSLEPIERLDNFFASWSLPNDMTGRVYVVQSPLAIPDESKVVDAEGVLADLAAAASWPEAVLRQSDSSGRSVVRSMAICGTRFGWNRHGAGKMVTPQAFRLQARRVILPGSVLVLKSRPADLGQLLLGGLGDGREQGFGALLPHPGIASRVYRPVPALPEIASRHHAGRIALEWFAKSRGADGPSPSQIAALARHSGAAGVKYLKDQMTRGSARHWQRWQPVRADIESLLTANPELARHAMRTWQDLAIIHRGDRED